MELFEIFTLVVSIVLSVTVVLLGYKSTRGRKAIYAKEEYLKIIPLGKSEIWNELRFKNPEWFPIVSNQSYQEINFSNYDFRGCTFIKCIFTRCNLSNSNFENTDLNNCNFIECNFSNSNFVDAAISSSNFLNNNLKEAIGVEESVSRMIYDSIPILANLPNKSDDEVLKIIDDFSPIEFEDLLCHFFERKMYSVEKNAEINRFTLDILLRQNGRLGENILIAVEVKKYSPENKIGLNTFNQIEFLIEKSNVHIGIIITNVLFSNSVKKRVLEYSKILLIDRHTLVPLLRGEYAFND